MLVGIFSLSPAISSLVDHVMIRSTGKIATATIAPIAYKSEIRGVFVHCMSYDNPNWDSIMQTCADYHINLVVMETDIREDSPLSVYTKTRINSAVTAAHARGIKLYLSMDVLITPTETQTEMYVVDAEGNQYPWACPTKQATRNHIRNLVEEFATLGIDGFMFDYIRYDLAEQCYCEECHQKFVQDTGLVDVVWRSDVIEGGRYHAQFMEWRVKPITELVRDIRSWMLAIKPDLEFSVAAWTLFQDAPTYWRYWIGQDTTDWISKDYLDMVAPMMYTTDLTELGDECDNDLKYMTGGPEGKIPLVAFLSDDTKTPTEFKAQIDLVRSKGLDGWIIWRYGGPGDGEGSNSPDIRNYLSLINMPNTFSLYRNIQVSASSTQATITWITSSPATSKIEYSTSPLFTASWDTMYDFHYWDIDHVVGIVIADNATVNDHGITLTSLLPGTKYYFRVQSQDPSGIATSKVLTFTTGS
jgi:hypothetical protein